MFWLAAVHSVVRRPVATVLGKPSKWVVASNVCNCPSVGADSQGAPSKAQATHAAEDVCACDAWCAY